MEAHGHVFGIGDTVFVGFNTGLGRCAVTLKRSLSRVFDEFKTFAAATFH